MDTGEATDLGCSEVYPGDTIKEFPGYEDENDYQWLAINGQKVENEDDELRKFLIPNGFNTATVYTTSDKSKVPQ